MLQALVVRAGGAIEERVAYIGSVQVFDQRFLADAADDRPEFVFSCVCGLRLELLTQVRFVGDTFASSISFSRAIRCVLFLSSGSVIDTTLLLPERSVYRSKYRIFPEAVF